MFGKKACVERGHRLREIPLRSRALWFMGWTNFKVPGTFGERSVERDDFAQLVVKHAAEIPGKPGDYRLAKFPGTETALYKTNLSDAFKGQPWWPQCFNLPLERNECIKELGSRRRHWITKPKNDYGGNGIRVWRADDPKLRQFVDESQGQNKSVVQSYLSDPLLIGGYKFHMRIHLIVTSLDPPEAFVQRNGQCLFATKPYTLSQDTMGESFDAPVHVTNMTFNATDANKENFLREKPVIGKGQQFRISQLERLLAKHHPNYSKEFLWGQVGHIAAEVTRYLARAPSVRRAGEIRAQRHFEIFGMDLMLDQHLNMFMCEVNTDPGMDYPDEKILGEPNPDYYKESGAAMDTLNDALTLLGLDAGRPQTHSALHHWFKVEFPEQNLNSAESSPRKVLPGKFSAEVTPQKVLRGKFSAEVSPRKVIRG